MFRCKVFVLFVLGCLGLCASAEAQTSILNFPKQLASSDLPTAAFALVNTSPGAVAVTFNLYGSNGTLVTQSTETVPAKGQLPILFPQIFPGITTGGWVQVSSSSPEIQGFELVGDFATLEDGAGPAAQAQQLSLIKFAANDIIDVVNTSSQSGNVQIVVSSPAGASLGTHSVPLGPLQAASFHASDLGGDNNIDLVTLTANVNISSVITTALPGGVDIGISNATPVSGAPSSLFFPYVPTGAGWATYVGISNIAPASQTISLTLNLDSGSPTTIQRTLAPNASLGDTVQDLFGTPSGTLTQAYVSVTGTGPLVAVAAYQNAQGSLAIVPSQTTGQTSFFFGHIASLYPWYTGIALLNTSTTSANVEVYALDSTGALIGSASTFSLPQGRKTALLSELVPQVSQRSSDGGWVFVRTTNGVPLLGFELFGHFVNPILANVQGFSLPSTSTYLPPGAAPVGANPAIDHLTITDANGNVKSQFSPKDDLIYVATITNTGATASAQLTFTITDPNNQVMTSTVGSITLPAASEDFPLSSYIPGNALSGAYTFTASLAYSGKTLTKSATFNVNNGASTASVGQDAATPANTHNVEQFAFRPGDGVHFFVPISNFTKSSANVTINYQLMGPGLFSAGTGSVSFSAPTGLSSEVINMTVPSSAQEGMYVFTSNMTVAGSTAVNTNGGLISVVPPNPSEELDLDVAFVSDANGIPRGGFTPGSSLLLNLQEFSSFAVPVPATLHYTVTAQDGTVVTDQSSPVALFNGEATPHFPLTLAAGASAGTYQFSATITYTNNANATKTSTATTTFVVGNSPPALPVAVTMVRAYITDLNFIARTSFSEGEDFIMVSDAYSTKASPLNATVADTLIVGSPIFSDSGTLGFTPGMTQVVVGPLVGGFTTAVALTFTSTVTVSGVNSTSSANFAITTPGAAAIPFVRRPSAGSHRVQWPGFKKVQ